MAQNNFNEINFEAGPSEMLNDTQNDSEDDIVSNVHNVQWFRTVSCKVRKPIKKVAVRDYEEKKADGRERRIVYTEELFSEVEEVYENRPVSPSSTLKLIKEQPWLQRNVMVKPNKLQKWFNKANAKPLTLSKAESMMQKMGWSGGALGKTGSGIVEPITPNLTYALNTKGFGQPERPKPKVKKPPPLEKMQKKQKREYLKRCFNINVLRAILDFVTNEKEVELLFDSKLQNHQRRNIHHLMEAIREIEDLKDTKLQKEGVMFVELIYKITKHNRYVLLTQSEGTPPNRYLCLYKEAPQFMYLVTHLDLRDHEKIVRVTPSYHQKKAKSKKKKYKNKYLKGGATLKHDVDETVSWMFEDDDENDEKLMEMDKIKKPRNVHKKRPISKDKVAELSKSTIDKPKTAVKDMSSENEILNVPESNIAEEEIVSSKNDEVSIASITEDISINSVNNIDNNDCAIQLKKTSECIEKSNTESVEIKDIDEGIGTDSKRTKHDIKSDDKQKMDVDIDKHNASNVTDDIDIDSIDENDLVSYETEDDLLDDAIVISDDEMTFDEENLHSNYKNKKEMLNSKIVSFFSEFSQEEKYTEFKFLGNFDNEEFEVVNGFIRKVWMYINGEKIDDDDLEMVIKIAECGFSMQEDCNNATVIIKVPAPSSKDLSIF